MHSLPCSRVVGQSFAPAGHLCPARVRTSQRRRGGQRAPSCQRGHVSAPSACRGGLTDRSCRIRSLQTSSVPLTGPQLHAGASTAIRAAPTAATIAIAIAIAATTTIVTAIAAIAAAAAAGQCCSGCPGRHIVKARRPWRRSVAGNVGGQRSARPVRSAHGRQRRYWLQRDGRPTDGAAESAGPEPDSKGGRGGARHWSGKG